MPKNYEESPIELFDRIIAFVFIITLVMGIAVLVSSCTTARKASKYYDKNRPKALEYCVSRFPPRDSISEVIRYLAGEVVIDTIDNSHVDTFITERTNTRTIIKYRTVVKFKTDTVTSIRTIYQTDKGANLLLQNAKAMIIAKDKAIHNRNTWVFGLALSWLLFILGILIRSLIINRLNRG